MIAPQEGLVGPSDGLCKEEISNTPSDIEKSNDTSKPSKIRTVGASICSHAPFVILVALACLIKTVRLDGPADLNTVEGLQYYASRIALLDDGRMCGVLRDMAKTYNNPDFECPPSLTSLFPSFPSTKEMEMALWSQRYKKALQETHSALQLKKDQQEEEKRKQERLLKERFELDLDRLANSDGPSSVCDVADEMASFYSMPDLACDKQLKNMAQPDWLTKWHTWTDRVSAALNILGDLVNKGELSKVVTPAALEAVLKEAAASAAASVSAPNSQGYVDSYVEENCQTGDNLAIIHNEPKLRCPPEFIRVTREQQIFQDHLMESAALLIDLSTSGHPRVPTQEQHQQLLDKSKEAAATLPPEFMERMASGKFSVTDFDMLLGLAQRTGRYKEFCAYTDALAMTFNEPGLRCPIIPATTDERTRESICRNYAETYKPLISRLYAKYPPMERAMDLGPLTPKGDLQEIVDLASCASSAIAKPVVVTPLPDPDHRMLEMIRNIHKQVLQKTHSYEEKHKLIMDRIVYSEKDLDLLRSKFRTGVQFITSGVSDYSPTSFAAERLHTQP